MKRVKLPFAKPTPRKFFDARLHDMLTYMRPHDTAMELDWSDKFIGPYKPTVVGNHLDDIAAYVIAVPCADGSASKVLFSAHVDTVHRQQGRQKVMFRETDNRYYKLDGQPLGADDGAGVWLLLQLIDAKVPGSYIFHRGEECGGIGSKWVTTMHPQWAEQFDYAIAFDRKATHSVMSHQGYGRCCSDKFAEALSDALNAGNDNFMYSPDDTGVYTDTAEYTDAIGECTNVSVGYYNEHTGREELDLAHLFALRDVCVKLDWANLPVVRGKGEKEASRYGSLFRTQKRGPDLFDMTYDQLYDMAHDQTAEFLELLFDNVDEFGMSSSMLDLDDMPYKTIEDELLELRARQESGMMFLPN